MTTAIKIENLSKKYFIVHKKNKARYERFSDLLAKPFKYTYQSLTNSFSKNKKAAAHARREEFWALQNISLEIKAGERVGIIGRNGAGKSTLLKILSRITEPTKGRVSLKGRVSSLLEVGTGFHGELTGRENIFLNGSILGMHASEIKRKFDEIVAFSEIEKFIDTPVKFYSSGMYVRLAFAIAAHLEPEILIVDEVLAVGDTAFQKKCLGKMEEVGGEGRTILFVSHNMNVVDRLCTKGFWLDKGKLIYEGLASETISNYLNQNKLHPNWTADQIEIQNYNDSILKPLQISLVDETNNLLNYTFPRTIDAKVLLKFHLSKVERDLTVGYTLMDENGQVIYRSLHTDQQTKAIKLIAGENILTSKLPINILNEGVYQLIFDASIHNKQWLFNPLKEQNAMIGFEIKGKISNSHYWITKRAGIIAPIIEWQIG